MRRRVLRWLQRTATLALVAAAAAVAGVALPALFGYRSLLVVNGSMGRAVPVGSVAVVEGIGVEAVRVGDVVTVGRPGASLPVTHRVVGIERDRLGWILFTKGDANASADPEPFRATSGRVDRVRWVVPLVGYLIAGARTPAGVSVLLGLPLAGLACEGWGWLRAARLLVGQAGE